MSDGQYYLIDPLTGKKTSEKIGIRFETELIEEAKVFDNGFVFYTQKFNFFYVQNVYEPFVNPFIDAEISKKPSCFEVVSPKHTISEKVEVYLPHI